VVVGGEVLPGPNFKHSRVGFTEETFKCHFDFQNKIQKIKINKRGGPLDKVWVGIQVPLGTGLPWHSVVLGTASHWVAGHWVAGHLVAWAFGH
jgi:hypothetical protein